jgi:endonuclease-3
MKDPTAILKILDEIYPYDGVCFLQYQKPWQLLFATILSAQCTDERVNQVTAPLFEKHPDLEYYAQASLTDLEAAIFSTGFYKNKAKHIKESAQALLTRFGGRLPDDIASLTALPGVGRKTANVVRSHIFDLPSIVVDTHVMRVSYRLGLTRHKDPVKIEYELMNLLPQEHWIRYNQQIITHGRLVCTARSPKCGVCALKGECNA